MPHHYRIHRCTRMTLRRMTLTCRPITTRQTLLLSMILPLHRRCPLLHWPTSLALTPPHPAVPALAACPRSPHRSASVVGSRTRRTTRHETAGGFACPLLRAKCPLLLCITPSTIKGHGPYLVCPTVLGTHARLSFGSQHSCRSDDSARGRAANRPEPTELLFTSGWSSYHTLASGFLRHSLATPKAS